MLWLVFILSISLVSVAFKFYLSMIRNILLYLTILILTTLRLSAQESAYTERARRYVEQYYALAIAEQRASGIPASITLGQGILETDAGTSELMTEANNHFGIKCKNNWQGPTFLHTDDAKDECFKKYTNAAESFKDHSAHLIRNPRYAPLFKCSQTDYASWAVGLKKCGYATNPQYAQRLIKIIEDFRLQEYTYSALDSNLTNNYPALVDERPAQAFDKVPAKKEYVKATKDTARYAVIKDTARSPLAPAARATLRDSATRIKVTMDTDLAADTDPIRSIADSASEVMQHLREQEQIHAAAGSDTTTVTVVNGLRAFYAHKGDMLLEYAVKYNMRYPHLLEMNDLTDAPLPFDMFIYLERKLTSGTHDKHTVADGETLLMVAQREGIQLKKLVAMNMLAPGEEPLAGAVLELQAAPAKPLSKLLPLKAHKTSAILGSNDKPAADTNMVATNSPASYSSLDGYTDTAGKTTETAASFQAPDDKDDYIAVQHGKQVAAPAEKKAISKAAPQDTAKKQSLAATQERIERPVYEQAKNPSFKDEVQQPQLKKPATEKEYKKGDKFYIVKRGDTAYSIAKRNEITVAQLLKWNDTEPQEIKAGQTLKIKE